MSGVQPTRRVYMAAADTTDGRTEEVAKFFQPDVVYLFVEEGWKESQHKDDIRELKQRLEAEPLNRDVKIVEVDVHNVHDLLTKATTLSAKHRSDDVKVNISSGPNSAGVGLAISAMATCGDAIRVKHSPSSEDNDQPVRPEDIDTVPEILVDPPRPDYLKVMSYIDELNEEYKTPKTRQLIDRAVDDELEDMLDGDDPEELKKSKHRSKRHNRFRKQFRDPMKEKGYIKVEERGRRKLVELTDEGKRVFEAFEHEIRS